MLFSLQQNRLSISFSSASIDLKNAVVEKKCVQNQTTEQFFFTPDLFCEKHPVPSEASSTSVVRLGERCVSDLWILSPTYDSSLTVDSAADRGYNDLPRKRRKTVKFWVV